MASITHRLILDGHALLGCDEGSVLAGITKLCVLLSDPGAKKPPRFVAEVMDSREHAQGNTAVYKQIEKKLREGGAAAQCVCLIGRWGVHLPIRLFVLQLSLFHATSVRSCYLFVKLSSKIVANECACVTVAQCHADAIQGCRQQQQLLFNVTNHP